MSIIDAILKKGSGKTATEEAIKSAEASIGAAFPDLLRMVYKKVANGGIGPGLSLIHI